MLKVNDVHLAYGKEPILEGITFVASPGEVVGLIGANGAGKSSLIEILAAVMPPDKGEVHLFDVSIEKRVPYLQMVGFVPQSIALTMHLSGKDNLRQWGALKGLSGDALTKAVDRAAALCDLTSFWQKPIFQQSGGMQRRVNLAAGLVAEPKLLLLDEPTAGLDKESRTHVLNAIQRIKEDGVIVVMTNHYEPEQALLADRQYVLNEGVLCEHCA